MLRLATRGSGSRALGVSLLALLPVAAALACARDPAAVPAAAPAASSPPVAAAVPAGVVVSGIAAPASGGFPAVVMLEPAGGSGDRATGAIGTGDGPGAGTPPAPAFMDQIGNAFYPPTLVARVGRSVEFLNSEGIMHNVNVRTDDGAVTVFNIATPPGFESYPYSFAEPGVYRVTCDIHPAMSAFIVAVETPYAAVADREGRFAIEHVAPGSYRARVWSLNAAGRLERAVEIPAGSPGVELDLRSPG